MVLGRLVAIGRTGLMCTSVVLARGWRCVNGLYRGLNSSSLVSLQATLLVLNALMFTAAKKARQRAEFVSAVKCINELDEQSLRLVLGYLPAWVKFSEFERARFVNESLQLLWPAFDRAICNVVKAHLEPLLQASAPAAVAGCCFEGLSFGAAPIQIVGIKNNTFRTASEQLGIVLDLDLRWAGQPDITLKLLPSRKWVLKVLPKTKGFDLTPEMHVAFNTLHVAGMLRVTLTPIVQDAPFVGGMSLSWLETPMIDFDVRGLGGADLMSLPAIADWIMSSVVSGYVAGMVWPRQVSIPFAAPEELEHWQAPIGVITVEVLEAKLPPRVGSLSRKEKLLNPYAVVVIGSAGTAAGSEVGGNVQSGTTHTVRNQKEPTFSEVFHLCVYDAQQVLKIVLAHDMDTGNREMDLTLGRVDVPLSELVAPSQLMRHSRQSGSVLAATQAHRGLLRARQQLHSPCRGGPTRRATTRRSGSKRGGIASSDNPNSQMEGRIGSGEQSARSSDGGSASSHPPQTSNTSWSLVGDGGAGIAAADVDSEEVESLLNVLGRRSTAPHAASVAPGSPAAPTSHVGQPSGMLAQAVSIQPAAAAEAASKPQQPLSPTKAPGILGFRSFAASGVTPKPRQHMAFRLKQQPRRSHRKSLKYHARHHTAHEAAVAAAGPDGAWLPLLSMKSAAGALQPWSSAIPSDQLPPLDSSAAPTHPPTHSSFFPQMAHLSALLRGPQPSDTSHQPTARATTTAASASGTATYVTTAGGGGSRSNAAAAASIGRDSRPLTAGIGHADNAAQQAATEGGTQPLPLPPPPQSSDAGSKGPLQPGAGSAPEPGFLTGTFWDWHKATSQHNPSSRLASWLVPRRQAPRRGSTNSLDSSIDNDGNDDDQETTTLEAANPLPATSSDRSAAPTTHLYSTVQHSTAAGADAASSSSAQEDSTIASLALTTVASNTAGSSRADAAWPPSRWQWHKKHQKAVPSKSKDSTSTTQIETARRGSLDLLSSLLARVSGGGGSGSSQDSGFHDEFEDAEEEAAKKSAVAYSSIHKADVLGLCKVRLSFHPIGGPVCAPVAATVQGSSCHLGVLLVQLQSASVTSAELTQPSVRLTLGDQVRQAQDYLSAQGGRVSWDATSFAFALSVGPSGPAADEIIVQVGNLSASLGDRLWATWFSSPAQYAHATQTVATARISIRPVLERGAVSGTYQMYGGGDAAASSPSAADAATGQISLKFSWRPALQSQLQHP